MLFSQSHSLGFVYILFARNVENNHVIPCEEERDQDFTSHCEDCLILSMCACVCVCAHVRMCMHAQLCLFVTPMGCNLPKAPLSMEFSRQAYWNGLPIPSSGDLPDPETEPVSLVSPALAGRFFTTAPPGKLLSYISYILPNAVDILSKYTDYLAI